MKLLLPRFYVYLVAEKIKEEKELQNLIKDRKVFAVRNDDTITKIHWIEKLLQKTLEDYRKVVLWKILCPYLVNVRNLSNDESFNILKEWLDECNWVRKLDFHPNQKIKDNLKHVGNFYPIGIQKLKIDDEE